MQLAEKHHTCSWLTGDTPLVLSDIFSPATSVTIWQRGPSPAVNHYFLQAFEALGLGINGVFSMDTLMEEMHHRLPEFEGKQDAVDDIYLLCDMLTCLFNCDSIGLRLAPLTQAMCPRFHRDNIPVRLVNTYLGPGTEWLPKESIQDRSLKGNHTPLNKAPFDVGYDKDHIQQMQAFDVGLLKGQAWPEQEHMAAWHRSCQLEKGHKRVLLTLDPM
ncbi:DUF1826 domain-containing protein [Alteromonas sp. 14N.309.X.WAT.G.H12]|uniref:DUF1826 domain-containing protein n=1 Tax=Alteromonas sp. 14N.309.X.WAT.G.H12 TaxID=3120824 RepID=UPI002FCF184B